MHSVTSGRWRILGAALSVFVAACSDDEGVGDGAYPATVADCGSSLDELYRRGADAQPSIDASYTEALASWVLDGPRCGLGVFTGECADGKRLLYRNGGFGSEVRYYDGERLVGYVHSGDVGVCPSVCPFSHFYGAITSVRCDAPAFDDLCESSSAVLAAANLSIPFANGQAPGGCGN